MPDKLLFAALLLTVLAASYTDLAEHRVPNTLNLIALCAALALHAAFGGWHGFGASMLGALTGFACFLPFYILRGMGAGDVKLLTAVGAFIEPTGAFHAALFSLLAGGITAFVYVGWRALRTSVPNFMQDGIAMAGASAVVEAKLARRDRLPFAVPIAVGSLAAYAYLILQGDGAWPLKIFH